MTVPGSALGGLGPGDVIEEPGFSTYVDHHTPPQPNAEQHHPGHVDQNDEPGRSFAITSEAGAGAGAEPGSGSEEEGTSNGAVDHDERGDRRGDRDRARAGQAPLTVAGGTTGDLWSCPRARAIHTICRVDLEDRLLRTERENERDHAHDGGHTENGDAHAGQVGHQG